MIVGGRFARPPWLNRRGIGVLALRFADPQVPIGCLGSRGDGMIVARTHGVAGVGGDVDGQNETGDESPGQSR